MIPAEFAHFENLNSNDHEDNQTDNLLNHFQLHQIKRAAGYFRADAVGRDHYGILKKSHAPAG